MSVACQAIVDRALDRSVANRGLSLVSVDAVLLARISEAEHAVFQRLASEQRTFYQTSTTLASTIVVSASPRTATLPSDCLRVLRVVRTLDGTEVAPVDLRFPESEYAPRYYQKGMTLVEVYPDWDRGSTAAVALTVDYVQGPPTPISVSGSLTQPINLPDEYADLLDNRLARYLAQKDLGRDPSEMADLDTQYESRYAQFVAHLDAVSGAQSRRYVPSPPESKA